MSAIYMAEDENGKYLVHKLGCKAMPHFTECRSVPDSDDAETALAKAKMQLSSVEAKVELCKQCWGLSGVK
jgi:hypothetical protein